MSPFIKGTACLILEVVYNFRTPYLGRKAAAVIDYA
jgi:hypothetical protein